MKSDLVVVAFCAAILSHGASFAFADTPKSSHQEIKTHDEMGAVWSTSGHWEGAPPSSINIGGTETDFTFEYTGSSLIENVMFSNTIMDSNMQTIVEKTASELDFVSTSFSISSLGAPETLTLNIYEKIYRQGMEYEWALAEPMEIELTRSSLVPEGDALLATYHGMAQAAHVRIKDPALGGDYVDLFLGEPSYIEFELLMPNSVQPFLPSDGNGDGWVDGLDYLIWAGNFGQNPGPNGDPSDGDYNDDGAVDGLDYLEWAGSFGSHATTTIPEPGAAALLIAGTFTCTLGRRSRHLRPLGLHDRTSRP
ncbi:MAG: hypothetical protein R3C10_09685 [Pirellulales bacterium]